VMYHSHFSFKQILDRYSILCKVKNVEEKFCSRKIFHVFLVHPDFKLIIWEGLDWVCLAQDTEQWQACVNAVMNLKYHKKLIFSVLLW
jgi:hypothetical protein